MIQIRPVAKKDVPSIKRIMRETIEFSKDDQTTCAECLDAYFAHEPFYAFACAEENNKLLGFICYDKASIAKNVYELYWIVVAEKARGKGIARMLDDYFVKAAKRRGARILFTETESAVQYAKARCFYKSCGYKEMARVKDFYDDGNDKIIYGKRL